MSVEPPRLLRDLVPKIRSKNAGPFWLTIDLFCGSRPVYDRVVGEVSTERAARQLSVDAASIKRFEIPDLNVLKLSLPRPEVQGSRHDRDLHGASWAALLAELEIGNSAFRS